MPAGGPAGIVDGPAGVAGWYRGESAGRLGALTETAACCGLSAMTGWTYAPARSMCSYETDN